RASRRFSVVAPPPPPADIGPLLDRGAARTAPVTPPDFGSDLGAGRTARVQAIADGSDANTATIALAYTRAIVQQFGADLVLQGRAPRPPIEARARAWFNAELSGRNLIGP